LFPQRKKRSGPELVGTKNVDPPGLLEGLKSEKWPKGS